MLLKRFKSSSYWVRAVDCSVRGEIDECLSNLVKYMRIRGDVPKALALYAMTCVRKNEKEQAKEYFRRARESLRDRDRGKKNNTRYIEIYTEYWLKALNGQPDENLVKEALKIPISRGLGRALPLAIGFEGDAK